MVNINLTKKARSVIPFAVLQIACTTPRVADTAASSGSSVTPGASEASLSGSDSKQDVDSDERYFEIVFVWVKKPKVFQEYLKQVGPVVARYGGNAERLLAPQSFYGEGMSQPDMVNVVFYDNKKAADSLKSDPEFLEVAKLRSDSINMVAVGGMPLRGSVSQVALEKRMYLVEIAEYGEEGVAAYQDYEREAEEAMGSYGYHVERVLTPDENSGFPFSPDVVKVAYFDEAEGFNKFHADPRHKRLEDELYPRAVKQSIWVTALVHPVMLKAPETD